MQRASPTDRELDELRDAIRARKLRATPARISVLGLLRRTKVPLTHDEVVRGLDSDACDRATIYRALNQLTDARLVRRADLGDHVWRFSIADSAGATHAYRAYFVCSSCGTVLDVSGIELTGPRGAPRAIGRGQIEVRVIGLCDDCL